MCVCVYNAICVYLCVCFCAKLLQSCQTLCDSMDSRLPDSSVHGILQARILEWVAIPFSNVCVCVCVCVCIIFSLIHSSVEGHCILPCLDHYKYCCYPSVNIGLYVSFPISVFLFFFYSGHVTRRGISASYGSFIFSFLRNFCVLFHSGWPNLHSHQQCKKKKKWSRSVLSDSLRPEGL